MSFWINTTNKTIAFNDDKSVYYSPTAPTSNALFNAILERQIASGISTANDPTDKANVTKLIDVTEAYTIAQLVAYVNAVAVNFVDGAYTGGATEPTMFTSSYANSANNIFALFTLVKALQVTKKDATLAATTTRFEGIATQASSGGDTEVISATYNAAEALSSNTPLAISRNGICAITYKDTALLVDPTLLTAHSLRFTCGASLTHYPTTLSISHSDIFYFKAQNYESFEADLSITLDSPTYVFFKQLYTGSAGSGHYCPDENTWGVIKSFPSSTSTVVSTPALFSDTSYTDRAWEGTCSDNATYNGYSYGFELVEPFVVTTWGFTHV